MSAAADDPVRDASRNAQPFPLEIFDQPRERPTGEAHTHLVDGGLFQAQCVCRWRGRRHADIQSAVIEEILHQASCGLCKLDRRFMAICSCRNCITGRILKARMRREHEATDATSGRNAT